MGCCQTLYSSKLLASILSCMSLIVLFWSAINCSNHLIRERLLRSRKPTTIPKRRERTRMIVYSIFISIEYPTIRSCCQEVGGKRFLSNQNAFFPFFTYVQKSKVEKCFSPSGNTYRLQIEQNHFGKMALGSVRLSGRQRTLQPPIWWNTCAFAMSISIGG